MRRGTAWPTAGGGVTDERARSRAPADVRTAFLRAPARGARRRASTLPEALARVGRRAAARARRERVRARRLRRLEGDYQRGRVGLRRGVRRGGLPASSSSSTTAGGGWRHGVENVPAHGRALLVANHAGILPWDATMMAVGDPARAPAAALPALPGAQLGVRAAVRVGGHPQGRRRGGLALQRDAAARAGRARGRVPRGREGHGQGLRASATGCSASAAAGSWRSRCAPARRSCRWRWWAARRSTPSSARRRCWRALTGAPYFPLTPTFPWLGPARRGAAAVEVADRVLRADRDRVTTAPTPPTDRALVLELSERVRATIQQKLYENLVKRGNAFV